jgi:hypothetical protein
MSQEQVNALQQALVAAGEQVMGLSQQLDQLRADATATAANTTEQLRVLREESSGAVGDLRTQVAALGGGKGSGGGGDREDRRGNRLINVKHFEPKIFTGKTGGDVGIKAWQKSVRSYCNARQKGFRVALAWAEAQPDAISVEDLIGTDWAPAEEANEELYEYLTQTTSDDALVLVEKTANMGFEAWRQLAKRYNPMDGTYELDRMSHLLARKQVKELSEVPAAVDRLVRDIDNYETRSATKSPQEWKLPLLKQILPEKHRKELEMRFSIWARRTSRRLSQTSSATPMRRESGSSAPRAAPTIWTSMPSVQPKPNRTTASKR